MDKTVINIENLSKFYRLGLIGGGTLRDDLAQKWAKYCGKPDPLLIIGEEDSSNRKSEYIWALKNINLEIKKGEILGIIGKNGAGKSTILKILSNITAPSKGKIYINGRIGSLLEVGTGFHPELTGMENIYLNGSILGMTKKEIDSKLEEIIHFSGVEQYINTPVKRFSSGMIVRLAFSVAAHLDPEILIIDEVLAVGDISFQKKCLGKIKDVSHTGRTVLFVSHNMSAILELCTRTILLKNGNLISDGNTSEVIEKYYKSIRHTNVSTLRLSSIPRPNIEFGNNCKLESCDFGSKNDNKLDWVIKFGHTIVINIKIKIINDLRDLRISLNIKQLTGYEVCSINSIDKEKIDFVKKGFFQVAIKLPNLRLLPGSYILGIGLKCGRIDQDYIPEAAVFSINYGKEDTKTNIPKRKGIISPLMDIQY